MLVGLYGLVTLTLMPPVPWPLGSMRMVYVPVAVNVWVDRLKLWLHEKTDVSELLLGLSRDTVTQDWV